MDNKQERRDEIQRKIRELQRDLTEINLQEKPFSDWNAERQEQLEEEIKTLQLELDKLS